MCRGWKEGDEDGKIKEWKGLNYKELEGGASQEGPKLMYSCCQTQDSSLVLE